jgi:hypothetical protein
MPKCFNGKYLRSQNRVVPCGKCRACKRKKKAEWASRIMQENIAHTATGGHSEFLTLTYRDDELPKQNGVPTLRKSAAKAFLHNQRNMDGSFRYYLTGEYGDLSGRPHLHMAIFCVHAERVSDFCKDWEAKHGKTDRKVLIPARCAYLAKYTTKALTKVDDRRLKNGQEPEFRLSSTRPGLGATFARMVADRWSVSRMEKIIARQGDVNRTFRAGGQLYPLTDYTLKKIREALEIPTLHRDREAHLGYQQAFPVPEAEQDQAKHLAQELKFRGEEASKKKSPYRRF